MNVKWPTVKLGEVLSLWDNSVPTSQLDVVNIAGVYSFARGLFKRGPISPGTTSYKSYNRLVTDDFVISQPKAWEGALARVTPEFEGWYLSPVFPTFRANRERLEPTFLEWFCMREPVWTELQRNSRGIGARRETVSPEQFLALDIPLPSLAEQRRIVLRIEEVSKKVKEAVQLRSAASEEAHMLWPSVARDLFIPNEGWRSLSIESCCEAIIDYRGRTPPISATGIPHLTSANIRNERINWNTAKFVSEDVYTNYMTRGIPKPGDVIFTMEAPLGETAVVPDARRFSLAQRTLLLRSDRTIIQPEFLATVLVSPDVREAIYTQSTGTTVKGIASKRLRQIKLPVPSLSEQSEIVGRLIQIHEFQEKLQEVQNNTSVELNALMPSILDRAFRGAL
jgi:type I restriction enzyme S subunit